MPSRQSKFILCALLLAPAFLRPAAGQTFPSDYLSEKAAARQEVINAGAITIANLDLGKLSPGHSTFSATVQNQSRQPATIALDLRAESGMFLRSWQQQFFFPLSPGEKKRIHAEYEFPHVTREATLRVRFGLAQSHEDMVTDPPDYFFTKRYSVGWGNPGVDFNLARLVKRSTEHLDVYCFPNSLAAQRIDAIAAEREEAYRSLSQMLGVEYSLRIQLIFYPDRKTKKSQTGHTGDGLAFHNYIFEVYNKRQQLDPYHELTHILGERLGFPPALFNEGFAVYVSEHLGADALKFLNMPGVKADEAVAADRQAGTLFPIEKLLTFTDIGPDETRPPISYPESASFVKYLIEQFGSEKFRQAYSSLERSRSPETLRRNQQTFREIYGKSPAEIEQDWLRHLEPTGQQASTAGRGKSR